VTRKVFLILLALVLAFSVGLVGCGCTEISEYSLTISSTEGGEITSPGDGTFSHEGGAEVPLVALPHTGYRFVNWTGDVESIDDVNSASTTIRMDDNYSVTANFIAQYVLTIESTDGGEVITPGEGYFTYDAGTTVQLIAEPNTCYQFVDWTGDVSAIAYVEATATTIIMNDDYTITASFASETVTYHIDYSNPELYLKSGNQSTLNEKYSSEINTQLSIENVDMEALAEILRWKDGYFTLVPGGGEVGRSTINQLMEEKNLGGGCHDHALVFASICRHFGFPAIMVDTAGIQWAYDYVEGRSGGWLIGHVFVEVYVNNNWILIDSTGGAYVEDYDPCNPVIPMTCSMESKGFFVLLKGLDPEEYGITSQGDFLGEKMIEFALNVESIDMQFPEYTFQNLFDLPP
jgi:hypothetical protein